jgi:hypothetical protein
MTTAEGRRDYEISFSRVSSGERLLGVTLVARDLTQRRAAEAALGKMRGQLLDASRRAGRAEVVTSLMHELGNALNGATVTASRLRDRALGLRVDGVKRVAGLLRERSSELVAALGDKAPKLVTFVEEVADQLARERTAVAGEAVELGEQLAQLGGMLTASEKDARAKEVFEEVDLGEVLASALGIDDAGGVIRDLEKGTTLITIRQRLLDIVVDLLGHARDVSAGQRFDVALRTRPGDGLVVTITRRGIAA